MGSMNQIKQNVLLLELIWVRAYTLLTPHMGNHLQLPYLLAHLHASNNSKKFKYGKNRLNILDLKILQVFFTNRGEILVFEKMLNFLSFLVLLYVSGHSKQKKNFKIFLTDRKISSPIHLVYWWWNFSISQKNFEKKNFCLKRPET